jgi:hypothetical protein
VTNYYRFKFSQFPGDLINFMPGIKHVCERDNKRAILILGLDINWQSVGQLTRKSPATISHQMFESLKPLLLSQPYIAQVLSWEEFAPDTYKLWCDFFKILRTPKEMIEFHNLYFEHTFVDLDKIYLTPTNIPYGNIHRWPWYCYPDMACDLSKPWIDVAPDDSFQDYIVVNRTLRARNDSINYKFLRKFHKKIMFIGFHDEVFSFYQELNAGEDEIKSIQYYTPKNLLELAVIIRSCKFFIGNQSLCFALAEAMKVPRILETCSYLPNVIPYGEKAYDFYFQSTLEYYFKFLNDA